MTEGQSSLVIVEAAAKMLAEADTVQKARELKSLLLTAADWARRKGMGEEVIGRAYEYATQAEIRMGELLLKNPPRRTGRPKKSNQGAGLLLGPSLAELGITPNASADAQMLASLAAGDRQAVIKRKKTKAQVKREAKERKREDRRRANAEKVKQTADPTVLGAVFTTVLIDPPWDWGDEGDVDQLGRARPDYATMSIEQLTALPVASLSDRDAHLYLWITNRSLPKGFGLLEAWRFRYVTMLTWPKSSFGMGNYFRGQTEHLLFGVRGSLPLKRKDAATLLPAWKRGPSGHSSKPVEIHEFIESCSPGPYLEMFSRIKREGWTVWGADAK